MARRERLGVNARFWLRAQSPQAAPDATVACQSLSLWTRWTQQLFSRTPSGRSRRIRYWRSGVVRAAGDACGRARNAEYK